MDKKIIAWDLGTGGNKASLYDSGGNCIAATFVPYETAYPKRGWHEQKPSDWWDAIVKSTRELMEQTKVDKNDIYCCGISGHSLGAVPMDKDGALLKQRTPIWSDSRADEQAKKVFETLDENEWYMKTGNGFTPSLYTAFKLLWYRDNEPDIYNKIDKVIGTKDYVNYRLTGKIVTDCSYASGSGVWDLEKWEYSDSLIEEMGLAREVFPDAVASTEVIGQIQETAVEELGLTKNVYVVAGGVDNSCMALGAKAFKEGRVYNSLGSCCWIAVSSQKPLLEIKSRPYVFTHVVPGYFASALCITSGGTSFRWVRDELGADFVKRANEEGVDEYELMTQEAAKSSVGANKLLFNPSLGGGMPTDKSPSIRGAFLGLDLTHTRADIIRAAMEGITFGQRLCLDLLRGMTDISGEMLLVGGGSKSALWRQIYADAYKMNVIKTNIDQQAAALGAAACAAVGTGIWNDFDRIDELHEVEERVTPIPENMQTYDKMMSVFRSASENLSDLGDMLSSL